MADNSSVPVAVGNETFANKDIAGVKFPKHIPFDSSGTEIVPATQATAAAIATAVQLIDDTVVAQGTALGSTKNSLVGGSVTTSAPTYTNGQVSPLNLDTAGNLRVNVAAGGGSGGTSSTVGSAAPSTATAVGFTDGTNLQLGVIKAASTAPVATDRAIVVAVSPNSQNANGTTTDANSTPVAWSTEGKAQLGSVTETAPASDTASSGLNGRLQRIAQNITTLIAATLKSALQATTAGGALIIRKIDLDEAPVAIKASAGQLYGFNIVNRATSPRFLRFYNIVFGSVTVGTSTIAYGPIEIPANASDHTAMLVNFPQGVEFTTAISMAATTGFADNDTGAPATNDLIINVLYK